MFSTQLNSQVLSSAIYIFLTLFKDDIQHAISVLQFFEDQVMSGRLLLELLIETAQVESVRNSEQHLLNILEGIADVMVAGWIAAHLNSTIFQLQPEPTSNQINCMRRALQEKPTKRKVTIQIYKYPLLKEPSYYPELLFLHNSYKVTPSLAQIFNNRFVVENLCIENRWVRAQWKGIVDLKTLKQPLSETIDFGDNYIEVYRNDRGKPVFGLELNKRCIVSFALEKKIHSKRLRKACLQNGTRLIAIDKTQNIFRVQIPHFTKFQFEVKGDLPDSDIEDSDDEHLPILKATIPRKSVVNGLQAAHRIIGSAFSTLRAEKAPIRLGSSHRIHHHEEPIISPPGKLQYEVDNLNQKKNEYQCFHTYELLFSANQSAFRLLKDRNQYMADELKRGEFQKFPSSSEFLQRIGNQIDPIQDLILREGAVSKKTKRIVSLIHILFNFQETKLHFPKMKTNDPNNKQLAKSHNHPRANQDRRCIKDWLEWTVRSGNLPIPSGIYSKLAFRKARDLGEDFISQNRFQDAEFLTCIQDEVYRHDIAEINLIPELNLLSFEDPQNLPSMHWMLEMGVQTWYFLKCELKYRIGSTVLRHYRKVKDYYEEFRVFSIYSGFCGCKHVELLSDPHQQTLEDLLCQWYISYRLGKYEKSHYKPKDYEKYRLRLLRNIIRKLDQIEDIIKLLTAESYLQQTVKNEILREVLMKKPLYCKKLITMNWPHKQDLIDEVQGCQFMNNYEYHNALERFMRISPENRSWNCKDKIIYIAHLSELLLNYRKTIVQRHLRLISRVNYPELEIVKIVLGLRLGTIHVDDQTLAKLCEYASELEKPNSSALMNLMFPGLEGCQLLPVICHENHLLYEDLLKLYKGNPAAIKYLKKMRLTYKMQKQAGAFTFQDGERMFAKFRDRIM